MPSLKYQAEVDAFGRRVQWLVEIDLDRCALNYTTSPCTATDQGDGARCFYTFGTCQDPTNFDRTTKTWRFCMADVPWPDPDVVVYPLLDDFTGVPQKVDPGKLFTFPEKLTVRMLFDHTPPATDSDKTLFNTSTSGEFWRNLWSRNRNYPNRPMRIKRGFFTDGFQLADFEQIGPDYLITEVKISDDSVDIKAASPLAKLAEKKVPWSISKDNTIQDSGGVDSTQTTWTVRDASEFPDPADYSRFDIYARCEDEYVQITAIDTGTNELTVVRSELGSTQDAHAEGSDVTHVAYFGPPVGSTDTARNVMDVIRDLMEWADIDESTQVNTAQFDLLKASVWTDNEIYRIVEKEATVAKHIQKMRESRGIIVYVNDEGKFDTKYIGPGTSGVMLTDDNFVEGTVQVAESEKDRITRVAFHYDPAESNPRNEPDDYNKSVVVVSAELENANNFGEKKERTVYDDWSDPDISKNLLRVAASRLITRYRFGERLIEAELEIKDASGLNVGDDVTIQTAKLLDFYGDQDVRPAIVVSKEEVTNTKVKMTFLDVNYSGRYLRIGPDTMATEYDSATAEDRAYGYWGDSDNRVGSQKEPGYVFP